MEETNSCLDKALIGKSAAGAKTSLNKMLSGLCHNLIFFASAPPFDHPRSRKWP